MTETLIDKCRDVAYIEVQQGNFDGNVKVEEYYSDRDFKAETNLLTKETYIGVNPRAEEKYGESFVLETVKSSADHEIDHHKFGNCIGCPQNVDKHHDLFFVPMYNVLSSQGFGLEDVKYATNALQDTILHDDLKVGEKKSLDGIKNFFVSVGDNAEKQKFQNFYEAHVKLNMYFWGNKEQKKQLGKYFSHSPEVKEVLQGFLEELGISKIKDDLEGKVGESIQVKNRHNIDEFFLDESNWAKISEVYAKHFSKLMTQGYGQCSLPNHTGAGTKGRESEKVESEGNVFDKEMNSNNFKKGKIMKADKTGEEVPKWIDKKEVLRIFYEGRAEEVHIKAETFSQPQRMPIAWYGERDFDPKRDNFRQIKFGINENGNVVLKKKPHSIEMEIKVKESPKSFPEIKFGFNDISVSMLEDIHGKSNVGSKKIVPWGDNSKYHWALETQFGIFEYFRRNHLLSQNSISSVFFGTDTKVVNGFKEVRDYLLAPKFESSTQLNFNKVKDLFKGRGNLIYTIGDGEMQNWNEIKSDFIEAASKHSYVHLHMGTPNDMTHDLKNAGFEVVIAEDGKGITKKMIDLTDKIFRGRRR